MDLGLRGRRAIVMASRSGLGRACAEALAGEGALVTINGRDAVTLDAVAVELSERHGAPVGAVAGDVADERTRAALLEACPAPDVLVTNNAGPPPAAWDRWDHERWIEVLEANLLAPILMARAVLPGMVERRYGRIVNITSAMVKAPVGAMGLSAGARAGLTAAAKALSRDVAHAGVTVNDLCPERFDTARQREMAELASAVKGISLDEAYAEIRATIPAGRLGDPAELGAACAFLCSEQAAYLNGQSISLDGGAGPGLW